MDNQCTIDKLQIMNEISQQTIYMMGASFVLGSMFTLFILLIMDWVRRDTNEK